MAGGPPVFSSLHPLVTLPLSLQFASYTQLARSAVLSNLPWETTVEAWIRSLSVSQQFKDEIALPWTASLIGSPRADALRASARSILQTFALTFPANIVQGATTFNSRIGLQGNLQRLLDRTPTARVHLNAPVLALVRRREGWFVRTRSRGHGPYGHVVLNLPPRDGRRLLRPLPGLAHVTAILDKYEYFDSRLLIHTDPAYVQRDPSNWAAYNAGITGRECEGSVWLGALGHTLPSGSPVRVFKSWAEHRRHDPEHILLERRFKHPVISRAAVDAARALRPVQGRDGLYFSGQYTTGFDSQEAAVYSAMKLAEALAPRSRRLAALKKLLAARGRAGISYQL
jgi:predicted NAD/FAD-binding protein